MYMINCKKMVALFCALYLLGAGICNAELKIFTASGNAIVEKDETLDDAKDKAFNRAVRNASEQAGIYVESYTKVRNSVVQEDEITVISSNVIKVNNVEYQPVLYNKNGQREIIATITATVDTNEIDQMSKKFQRYESELVKAKDEIKNLQRMYNKNSGLVIKNITPNIIITHNEVIGELNLNVFKAYFIPNRRISLYKEPYKNLSVYTYAEVAERLNIVATEIHSYPDRGEVIITGNLPDDIYYMNENKPIPKIGDHINILYYSGEGYCVALYRGNRISIPLDGIQNAPYMGVIFGGRKLASWARFIGINNEPIQEEWYCVKRPNSTEGWFLLENEKNNLEKVPYSGIYHLDYKKDR